MEAGFHTHAHNFVRFARLVLSDKADNRIDLCNNDIIVYTNINDYKSDYITDNM